MKSVEHNSYLATVTFCVTFLPFTRMVHSLLIFPPSYFCHVSFIPTAAFCCVTENCISSAVTLNSCWVWLCNLREELSRNYVYSGINPISTYTTGMAPLKICLFWFIMAFRMNWVSVVGKGTRLWAVQSGVKKSAGAKKLFCCVKYAGWLWSPPSVLFNGYWDSFLGGEAVRVFS
jgi:hypothetical protein